MPHLVRNLKELNPRNITCGIMRELTNSKDFEDINLTHVIIENPTKKHYHKKLTEVYYVLKGSVDVEIDGAIEHLEEGQMIMIFPGTNHKAWKTSKENAEILVICCPSWAEEDEIFVE